MAQKLNEGLANRLISALFKKLFKGEIKQAEETAKKLADKLSDEDKIELGRQFDKVDKSMENIRKYLK